MRTTVFLPSNAFGDVFEELLFDQYPNYVKAVDYLLHIKQGQYSAEKILILKNYMDSQKN